jgi:uncharacterized protein YodC (DUF2158 family)
MSVGELEFSIGALVQLKSGGPNLTIRTIKEGEITVEWFEGETLKSHSFLSAQIQLVPDKNVSDLDVARRIAFLLQKAAREVSGFEKIDSNNVDAVIEHVLTGWTGTNK